MERRPEPWSSRRPRRASAPIAARGGPWPDRPGYVVAGAVLAAALPLLLGAAARDADITSLGQHALTYGLPWGAGLASAGWLEPGPPRAAVAGSAVLAAATALL
jgi:hypothetical protein